MKHTPHEAEAEDVAKLFLATLGGLKNAGAGGVVDAFAAVIQQAEQQANPGYVVQEVMNAARLWRQAHALDPAIAAAARRLAQDGPSSRRQAALPIHAPRLDPEQARDQALARKAAALAISPQRRRAAPKPRGP